MHTGEQRYLYDPEFKALVDHLAKSIATLRYSPSEIRDAAMLACIHYEMNRSPLDRHLMDAGTEQQDDR